MILSGHRGALHFWSPYDPEPESAEVNSEATANGLEIYAWPRYSGAMDIDHVVLWVESPKRALEFYVGVLGLAPVRAQDFEEGKASFPSVRVNEATILDLMDRSKVPGVREFTGSGGDSGGAPINHVCLSMTATDYASLTARLVEHGVELKSGGERAFGAGGQAEHSVYFSDPDGNVLEIRHYDEVT